MSAPKTLKVTASNLEAYRLWRLFDFITTDELFARIRGDAMPEPSFEVKLGNAYHELVLKPWFNGGDGIVDIEGFMFDTFTACDELADVLPLTSTFEVWGRRYFSNYWAGHTVYFLGRLDAMFGNEILDLKVSLKSKDPVTHLDSLQWPLYCETAGCRKFTYIDVQLRSIKRTVVHPAYFQTVKVNPLTLYLSDSIARDFKVAVIDYLQFVENAGLLDFIDDNKKLTNNKRR